MAKATTQRPGFLFVACPDVQILLATVEEQARIHAPAGGTFKRVCFWGDEAPGNAFWEALTVRDLFGSMRLVLVRQANLWNTQTWKTLDKMLARPLAGSFPVFCVENDWERGRIKLPAPLAKLRCVQFATKQGWLLSHPGLTDKTIRGYVKEQAQLRGLALDTLTMNTLCENTPRQAGVVCAELDKLALLAQPGQPVTVDMLGTASWSPEAQVFGCINCLLKGDARGTWRELARVTDMDSAALQLLGLLVWNFRTLWLMLVGDTAPRSFSLTPALAKRIGAARLARCLELVMDAEAAIKTGSPARQTMEMTFSELLMLFGKPLQG